MSKANPFADLRRENLRALISTHGQAVVAKTVGKPDRQIADLASGRAPSFGEKLARDIEMAWLSETGEAIKLDVPGGCVADPIEMMEKSDSSIGDAAAARDPRVDEEAAGLRARFEGVNRAGFARDHGVKGGQAMIYQHITGRRPINLEAAIAYAAGFGCPLEEISPRLAMEAQKAASLSPDAQVKVQDQPQAWPFPAVPRDAIEALSPAKLERLQGALALALAQVQQDLIVPVKPQEKRGGTVSLDDAGDPFPMVLREPMPWEAGWKPTEAADLPTRVQDRGGVVANVSPGTPPAANDRFEKVVELGEVRLAAGEGIENDHELETGAIQFRRSFLRSVGADGGRGRVVYAKGNSMEPQIPDGSALLLVPSDAVDVRSLVPNSVYAINYDGKMIVKTVVQDQRTGKWVARSANSTYPDIALESDASVRILGRVVWAGGLLREGDAGQWARRG